MKLARTAFVFLLLAASSLAAADWQVMVHSDGTFSVTYRHTPVVRCHYVFFGPHWKWAASQWTVHSRSGSPRSLAGTVPDLALRIAGSIGQPSPDKLTLNYEVTFRRDLAGIMGGGLEFTLAHDSPALRQAGADEPVLIAGNRGWRWPVGGGQEIKVSFDAPIPRVHFEQGSKGRIRTMFVGSREQAGQRTVTMSISLPAQTVVAPSPDERYGPQNLASWHHQALADDTSPVDVSFLNDKDRPAGRRGFIRADGDRLVFQDGTEARFWGTNLSAYALFDDKAAIRRHARRIAQLGYNLVRIHHHDSAWVKPNVLSPPHNGRTALNAQALDAIDWWVKCLKDEGVYIWLDLHVGRGFTEAEVPEGHAEFARRANHAQGYAYFNDSMQQRMREFNEAYLSRLNGYTRIAYKDEPAVIGLLITNENDLTFHFGNPLVDRKTNPYHGGRLAESLEAFCRATGFPPSQTWRTWEPGPAKMFMAHREAQFNAAMLEHLRGLGVSIPVATTNYWSGCSAFSLPSLANGDIIAAHSYGKAEALSVNSRAEPHYISAIAGGRLADRPIAISEWNVFYPAADRFTSPMWMAAIASLQSWNAPMVFVYANAPLSRPWTIQRGVTYNDPAITALMPAAAIAFRRGDIQPAREHFVLKLTGEQVFHRRLDAGSSATIRTLIERSRISLALPDIPEFDWDRATSIASDAKIVTDPDRDFLGDDGTYVESDTGQIRRDWARGLLTIHTPRTVAASGWMDGPPVEVGPATFELTNPKATAVLTSLDGRPIDRSRRILLTIVARATLSPDDKKTFYSEPIRGQIALRSGVADLALVPINVRGQELTPIEMKREKDSFIAEFPAEHGTHWYLLKAAN
jgi:hypothetical protein